MAHRSQSSSVGDNPLDPNYLPPHYREDYRLAIDSLIESDIQGYYEFLQSVDVVSFLAQPEIEYIKSSVQSPNQTSNLPELTYHEGGNDAESSSDTYWPMHSDLAAPVLDLGWPMTQHSFVGPTEVTTLVNPSDPDMPSIKEQARRLIKNARQKMRVRTVAGISYYTRTGKSFKGQVKDRFLLADCRAVLSGNYSFMWSYEKIHRCIAHLFLGELVATFDEEFRILFAQSEPLVIDPSEGTLAVSDTSSTSSYYGNQFGLKRNLSLRNPIGLRRQPEIPPAFTYGDSDRNLAIPFRRNDPFRQTVEPGAGITIGKYSQQQFRLQQSFLEQGRSIVSRQMEISNSSYKRHSYAEGTQENYTSSRQYMKHRVMNNLEETDFHMKHYYKEGPEPGSGHGHYDRVRGRPPHLSIDQYSESSYRSDLEPPLAIHGRDYFSSEDLGGPDGHQAHPLAGRYRGGSSHKRPSIGQSYACQSSPTQLHPPEKKPFSKQSDQEHDQDESVKQGLRSWRINSYLSTFEDVGEEGLTQPMGPDAFEDPTRSQQPNATQSSAPPFGKKEQANVPSKPRPDILRPRFGKPILSESTSKDSAQTSAKDVQEKKKREIEKEKEGEPAKEVGVNAEGKEDSDAFLSKHESIRSRFNPLLQRSSRLRSSLIFSSSKTEMHSGSLGLKVATEEDEELNTGRTSSIVAKILEKRRSFSREPFDWRQKAEEREKEKEKEKEEKEGEKEHQQKEKEIQLKDETKEKEELQKNKEDVKTTPTVETSEATTSSSLNMNDPASRLQYFKDLAAKRKVSYMEMESSVKTQEPAGKKSEPELKKPDLSTKLTEVTRKPSLSSSKPPIVPIKITQSHKEENTTEGQKKDIVKSLPSPKIFKGDSLKIKGLNPRHVSCGEEILTTDATDAEKSEQKKRRCHSSSNVQHEDSKDKLQKNTGSNTSINTLGSDGKVEGKPLDFIKKQTQRLKGLLGPKDKEKKSAADDKGTNTVREKTEDSSKKQSSSSKDTGSTTADQTTANHKTSSGTSVSSRYQSPASSVLFSSNLRDDTKVILEQISANSQKKREETGADRDSDAGKKEVERQNSIKNNQLLRPGNIQEREGLLKRIESMRKEKKVYSRFEKFWQDC
ncbi:hypothetical protein PAMP_008051 [Pampus punctatissimus]